MRMTFPPDYDPERVGGLFQPNIQATVAAGWWQPLYRAEGSRQYVAQLETVNSVMRRFFDQPAVIQRRRNLEDAISSVVIPGIDFDALADNVYRHHRAEGLTFTSRTEPTG